MLNANFQLIQCTHITDLLSNLKGILDSMIIKIFIVMQNVSCSQMCQNHQTFISCSLVHNFNMCNNNYLMLWKPWNSQAQLPQTLPDFLFTIFLAEISCLIQTNSTPNESFFFHDRYCWFFFSFLLCFRDLLL